MSNSIHEEPITNQLFLGNTIDNNKDKDTNDVNDNDKDQLSFVRSNICNTINFSKIDNFYENLNKKLENDINNIFEKYNSYTLPKSIVINDNNKFRGSDLNDPNNNKFDIFMIHLEKIKRELEDTFVKLIDYEKKVSSVLEKQRKFTSKLKHFEELENIISKTHSEQLKKIINDISQDIAKNNLDIDLKKYILLYKQHINNIKNFKRINCLNSVPMCSLCLTNPLMYTIVPCGHTFCQTCIGKLGKCGICRQDIKHKQKIYII